MRIFVFISSCLFTISHTLHSSINFMSLTIYSYAAFWQFFTEKTISVRAIFIYVGNISFQQYCDDKQAYFNTYVKSAMYLHTCTFFQRTLFLWLSHYLTPEKEALFWCLITDKWHKIWAVQPKNDLESFYNPLRFMIGPLQEVLPLYAGVIRR